MAFFRFTRRFAQMKFGIKSILTIVILGITTLALTKIPVYHKQELLGKIEPSEHEDFIMVSHRWTTQNTYLRKEAYYAFVEMATAAETDGIHLLIVSGTRNYRRQKEIWEEKWQTFPGNDTSKAGDILEYSSMPGTSRHHWGTDLDINTVEADYFETPTGKKVYKWLKENAWKYGYFQPYNKLGDHRDSGYKEEKWHWSYFPISYRLLKAYNKIIEYPDINGFSGSELSKEWGVLENYVNGIHSPRKIEEFKKE